MKILYVISALLALGLVVVYALLYPLPGTQARPTEGERREVMLGEHRLVYFARGDNLAAITAVLIASARREASDFNELTASLVQAGYRTLAVEAPGIGDSDLPEGTVNLYDLAEGIKAVVDAEVSGPETAVAVIGHAFGNRVARAAATRYPGVFNAVVLIAAGGKNPIEPRANQALKNCFNPVRTASQRLDDLRYAFFADGNDIPDYWRRGWHIKTALMQGAASPATPDTLWLAGGEGDMLVVQGSHDRIAPKADTADVLQQQFPKRVEVVVIPNTGHALLPERPDEIAEAVMAFLARHTP